MLLHKLCSTQNLNVRALSSTCNIRWQTAVPHCACNTDNTEADGRRKEELINCNRKQQELKFTFTTEQCNSSLLPGMWKTVDAVQLSWNKNTINDNNCHTGNGDEIHCVQFC